MLAELQTDPEEDDLPGLLAILDECRESYHLFRESLSNYSEGSTHQDQYRVQWIQCLETIERNEEGIERSVRSLEWYRCRLGAHSREVLALTSGVVTPLQHFESVLPDEPTIEEVRRRGTPTDRDARMGRERQHRIASYGGGTGVLQQV